jgi:predicted TIM-barrel fold metal-dependent hydrolase
VVRELHERLAPVSDDARRKVLGDNARRFYHLAG